MRAEGVPNMGSAKNLQCNGYESPQAETSFDSKLTTKCNKSAKPNGLTFKITFLARPSRGENPKSCPKCNVPKCSFSLQYQNK